MSNTPPLSMPNPAAARQARRPLTPREIAVDQQDDEAQQIYWCLDLARTCGAGHHPGRKAGRRAQLRAVSGLTLDDLHELTHLKFSIMRGALDRLEAAGVVARVDPTTWRVTAETQPPRPPNEQPD